MSWIIRAYCKKKIALGIFSDHCEMILTHSYRYIGRRVRVKGELALYQHTRVYKCENCGARLGYCKRDSLQRDMFSHRLRNLKRNERGLYDWSKCDNIRNCSEIVMERVLK